MRMGRRNGSGRDHVRARPRPIHAAIVRWFLFGSLAVALWSVSAIGALAVAAGVIDEHARHHHAVSANARSTVSYSVPDITLVRDDGKAVQLAREMDDGRPVVLTFIYTSCTTVCPLTSLTLAQLQDKLGPQRDSVRLISISIDPEQDSPGRLREYAKQFKAGPEWHHYTGTLAASVAAQRAFNVYRGNKMDHDPVILIRSAPGDSWVRIEGFATADQLLAELPDVCTSRKAGV